MLNAALLVLAAAAPGVYDPIFHSEFEQALTCPQGRQQFSDMGYMGDGMGGETRSHVNVTEWENIWGHANPYDSTVPWPGRHNAAPIILDFGKQSYIAAHFYVTPGTPETWLGWISHTEYVYGHDLTAAISVSCGDFSPSNPLCRTVTVSGQLLVPWRTNSGNVCPLQPGVDYYLNLKITNPDAPSTTCASNAEVCAIGTANEFGP